MGRRLLSGLSDVEAEQRLLASELRVRTRHTVTGLHGLLARVREAREQGWCLVDQ